MLGKLVNWTVLGTFGGRIDLRPCGMKRTWLVHDWSGKAPCGNTASCWRVRVNQEPQLE